MKMNWEYRTRSLRHKFLMRWYKVYFGFFKLLGFVPVENLNDAFTLLDAQDEENDRLKLEIKQLEADAIYFKTAIAAMEALLDRHVINWRVRMDAIDPAAYQLLTGRSEK